MEAITFQSKDVINAMELESGLGMSVLRVDGGVSRSDFAMQFQADILGVAVERPKMTETTALGAAYLAGLAVGYFGGMKELTVNRQTDTVFMPDMKDSVREEKYFVWRKAVEKAKGWI
jgi:glycerol kinase